MVINRWESYFKDLPMGDQRNHYTISLPLARMKKNRALDPNEIPIDAWVAMCEIEVHCLTTLFNKIYITRKMNDDLEKEIIRRKSELCQP